ncbi:MAG: DUF4301 family protein, partial [Bacteroidales bacterium]|nr:DUF4301 family protein [Bacteroidales bacterium]
MLTQEQKQQILSRGISEAEFNTQLNNFVTGFPFLKIEAAASVGNGILVPDEQQIKSYLATWDEYCKSGKEILKFVPASGAASRMFKDLFSFLSGEYDEPTTDFEKNFFANIEKFAFYNELEDVCVRNNGA